MDNVGASVRHMPKPDQLRPDIDAAAAAMKGVKIGSNREIRKLEEYLAPGETVRRIAGGYFAKGQGLLALTDRRLFFLTDGIMKKTSEDFPFARVSSVSWRSGMVQGTVVILAAGSEAKIERVYKDDGRALVDDARALLAAGAQTAAVPAPAAPVDDIPAQIQKLAGLRDAGILSADEFEAKKAELLARM